MIFKDEKVVLVLQGGGALGAYQAGAYSALHEAGIEPDWVAGISIGAINSAIISGNKPEDRVKKLRAFWEQVSSGIYSQIPGQDLMRGPLNALSAATVAATGVPGFFTPRFPPAVLMPPGTPEAVSLYDTTPLKNTLHDLVDFKRLNSPDVRYSAGAVNIETGNFTYFDSTRQTITAEHIMASGALPPGFGPVVIDGEAYWDGGLVSNTPLQYVLDFTGPRSDMCVFQVDLFNARGGLPANLLEVARREKEIRYSSRTRLNTDAFKKTQEMRRLAHRVLEKLPPALRQDPDVQKLMQQTCNAAITIVHLIHRRANYERQSMDYEFSRLSMEEHWAAGYKDVAHTLKHPDWQHRTRPEHGVSVLDLTQEQPQPKEHTHAAAR